MILDVHFYFMPQPINFLRLYRKRSPLTQADIAFLLGLPDYSNISRCEKGQRAPSVELLLVYHLLFNTTVESFFEHKSEIVRSDLVLRIEQLLKDLRKEDDNSNGPPRIVFLEQSLKRLTN